MSTRTTYDWDVMTDGTLQFVDFDAEELVEYRSGTHGGTGANPRKLARPLVRQRGLDFKFLSACRTRAARQDLVFRSRRGEAPGEDGEARRVRVWYQFLPRGDEERFSPWLGGPVAAPTPVRGVCASCGLARSCPCDERACGKCGSMEPRDLDTSRCPAEWPPGSGQVCGEIERY